MSASISNVLSRRAAPEESLSPASRPAADKANAWCYVAAAALAVFYLGTSLYIASHRPLWIDEVLTAMTTRLPGYAAIWRAFARGADGLPPTYFMLMRPFDALFRHSDFGLRVPSALAMTAGMLLTFDCARRLSDALHGLIAFAVLTCSFLPYYGHEARSYAFYFLLAALALWIWTCDQKNSWPAAIAFGLVMLLALTMHYYAVLCLVPYAMFELANWKRGRLPSRKLAAGVIGVLCAIAMLRTAIEAGRRFYPANYLTHPSLDILRTTFADLFPDALFLMGIIMVWIAWVARNRAPRPLPGMQAGERLGWFFFLIPAAGYLLAQVAHAFQLRYLIATLPGIAVAFACCLWRHFGRGRGRARYLSLGVLLILAGWGVARQVYATRNPESGYYSPVREISSMEGSWMAEGKQYFVVSNPSRYLEALYYSRRPGQYVYFFLDYAGQHEMRTLGVYYPMHFWTLEDLKQHAPETALIMPDSRIVAAIRQAGMQVATRSPAPVNVDYLH